MSNNNKTAVAEKNQAPALRPETGIDIRSDGELQVTATAVSSIQEMQAAVFLARRFPRDYDQTWAKLQKSCMRQTFANVATYSYERGQARISGPSVHLARAAGQCYGNIRWGLDILRNDADAVLIQGWAWDIENNTKSILQDAFEKLIYRKDRGMIKPDERDLRELINRRGAILIRNCLFNILPRDLIEDAVAEARKTLKTNLKDPDSEKKHLILKFMEYGITVQMIKDYLEHDAWTPDDIIDLKGILNALKDGAAKPQDYFNLKHEEVAQGGLDIKDMKGGEESEHQGVGEPEAMTGDQRIALEVYVRDMTPRTKPQKDAIAKAQDYLNSDAVTIEDANNLLRTLQEAFKK